MKVTLAPSLGSMEVMRELRDPMDRGRRVTAEHPGDRDVGDRGARGARPRQPREQLVGGHASGAYPGASYVAAALTPLGPNIAHGLLSNAQSLPALLSDEKGSKVREPQAASVGSHHGADSSHKGRAPISPS